MEDKIIKPNKKQQECIDNINGQYLVLAGPGTGKTFTVSKRIKSMYEKGINPDKILCLTYTEIAALEMKTKIEKELNNPNSGISIYTFHSFCNEIIKDNYEIFGLDDNVRKISDAISKEFLKECVDIIKPINYIGSKKRLYSCIKDIQRGIVAIKQNRLTKETFLKNLETNQEWIPELERLKKDEQECIEKQKLKEQGQKTGRFKDPKNVRIDIEKQIVKIEKMKELWALYELYQKKMNDNNYIDFDDMINMVLDMFEKDPAFLNEIANNYEYILVDEYQDTNPAQNEIIFKLVDALESKNVFVVGDDDQIIFSFQGARLDTMERFLRQYPDTKVICLTENMRSTQNILDISRKVSLKDKRRLEYNQEFINYGINKELIAKNEKILSKEKPVNFTVYKNENIEQIEIVKDIEALINSPFCPVDEEGNKKLSEIAILTTGNKELGIYANLLKDKNIQFQLKDGKNIFDIKSSLILYYYMSALVNVELYSDRLFKLMLLEPFQINAKDYCFISLNKNEASLIDYLKQIPQENLVEPDKIKKFIDTYDYLKEYSNKENLRDTILEIGSKTGIFDYYINNELNKSENIAGIKKIVDEAIDFASINKAVLLVDFVNYLDMFLEDDELEIRTEKPETIYSAIQLSTFHSSKGREFEIVYMPSLMKRKWESNSKKTLKPIIPLNNSEAKTKEEYKELKDSDCNKLMYVGMTRAKHTLNLSCYESATKGNGLSSFISDITSCCKIEDKSQEEKDIVFEYLSKPSYDYKRDFTLLIQNRIKDFTYSPTSLNTYRKCPRQFLYDYILKLTPKSGSVDNRNFGTAIHNTLECFVRKKLEENKILQESEVIEIFKKQISNLPISTPKQRIFLTDRGINAIKGYYHHLIDFKDLFMEAEKTIYLEIDGHKFVGKIDRIDKIDDENYAIYDYKTGNAKKAYEIQQGGAYENYYYQIGFYKHLFEKSENKKVKKLTFIFPEEPESPVYLELTDEQINDIKNEYLNVIKEIENYNFEPSPYRKMNKDFCNYCSYKNYCGFEVI